MKNILLLPVIVLLTGCAQYAGVAEPGTGTYGTPIYPPTFDIHPMRNVLQAGATESQKLMQFVGNDNNLIRLRWALERYQDATEGLYNAINTAPGASITYTPWQMPSYQWHRQN